MDEEKSLSLPTASVSPSTFSATLSEEMLYNDDERSPAHTNLLPAALMKQNTIIVEGANIDLKKFLKYYRGDARIQRLIFIADACPLLRIEALTLAINCVKKTYNVRLYAELFSKLKEALEQKKLVGIQFKNYNQNDPLPSSFNRTESTGDLVVNNTSSASGSSVSARILRIRNFASRGAHNSQISIMAPLSTDVGLRYDSRWLQRVYGKINRAKEVINALYTIDVYTAHMKSAESLMRRGEFEWASLKYIDARLCAKTMEELINASLGVIRTAILRGCWTQVAEFTQPIECCMDLLEDQQVLKKVAGSLNVAVGFVEMYRHIYEKAAISFLRAIANKQHYFNDIVSNADLLIYAGLCVLATVDPEKWRDNVISSESHYYRLIDGRSYLSEIVVHFYAREYCVCFDLFDDIRNNLMLDMFLAPHVLLLRQMMFQRALQHYVSPYIMLELHKIERVFPQSFAQEIEYNLDALMETGEIKMRWDENLKVLYALDVLDTLEPEPEQVELVEDGDAEVDVAVYVDVVEDDDEDEDTDMDEDVFNINEMD